MVADWLMKTHKEVSDSLSPLFLPPGPSPTWQCSSWAVAQCEGPPRHCISILATLNTCLENTWRTAQNDGGKALIAEHDVAQRFATFCSGHRFSDSIYACNAQTAALGVLQMKLKEAAFWLVNKHFLSK